MYKIPGADIPIVHRVLETHDVVSKECVTPSSHRAADPRLSACSYVAASPLAQPQLLLTKGDNNPVDDLDLYQGLEWLERRHIIGKVQG